MYLGTYVSQNPSLAWHWLAGVFCLLPNWSWYTIETCFRCRMQLVEQKKTHQLPLPATDLFWAAAPGTIICRSVQNLWDLVCKIVDICRNNKTKKTKKKTYMGLILFKRVGRLFKIKLYKWAVYELDLYCYMNEGTEHSRFTKIRTLVLCGPEFCCVGFLLEQLAANHSPFCWLLRCSHLLRNRYTSSSLNLKMMKDNWATLEKSKHKIKKIQSTQTRCCKSD